jgi:hypothetical protein
MEVRHRKRNRLVRDRVLEPRARSGPRANVWRGRPENLHADKLSRVSLRRMLGWAGQKTGR